jgi:ubiquinone/menaquinone biosynthesis C-methylase UbiE
MNNEKSNRICPVEIASGLDNSLRKLLQNPQKLLKPYIAHGMTVLDLGCGPGYFSVGIAYLLNDTGKVIAADLQEGMLKKVGQKIKGTDLEQRIVLHKCMADKIDLTERVDFVLAFYMIHEVPDQDRLFNELRSILKPDGRILIVEPKFHVSKVSFDAMIERLKDIGFEIKNGPKVFFSRTVVAKNME